jgi:hypothetical protein
MFEITVGTVLMLFLGLVAYFVYLMNGIDRRKR